MSHGKEGDDITPPPAQQPMQTAAFGGLSTDPVAFQNALYPFGTAVPPPLTSWAPPYVATLPSPYYLQAMAPAGYMNYSAAVPPGHWPPSSYAPPPPAPTYVTHHQHHLPSATGQHMVSMGTPLNAPPFAPYVHSTFLPSYALPQLPTTLDPSSFQATARAVPTAATLVETLPRGTDMTPMSANVPNAPPPPQVVDNVRFSSAKQKRRPKPRNLPAPAPGHTDCTQLVVFYLALEINDVGLRQLFSPFEGFLHGRVVVDSSTGVSRGFGYLWFDTQERAMAVIEAASGRVVLGKRLRIDFANPQSPYTPSS